MRRGKGRDLIHPKFWRGAPTPDPYLVLRGPVHGGEGEGKGRGRNGTEREKRGRKEKRGMGGKLEQGRWAADWLRPALNAAAIERTDET